MGVVLHKDSKWFQQWMDFKDNNVVFNSKKILQIFFLQTCHLQQWSPTTGTDLGVNWVQAAHKAVYFCLIADHALKMFYFEKSDFLSKNHLFLLKRLTCEMPKV